MTMTRQDTSSRRSTFDPPPGIDAATLCEAFQLSAAAGGDTPALRAAGGGVELSWRQYASRVESIARGLDALGVRRGDTVALMMSNRPEFHLVDTAALHLGATPFSIYNTSASEQIAYLFGNARPRVVVTEAQFVDRIRAAVPGLDQIVLVDGEADGARTLAELESLTAPGFDFEAAWRSVAPDDLATLIYTSGTTGPPKGVEITHGNLMWEWRSARHLMPLRGGGRVVSYLPLAHMADRFASHYCSLVSGATVTSVADPRQLVAALPEVRPTIFAGVPRIWEKLHAALLAQLTSPADPDRRKAGLEALEVGGRMCEAQRAGESVDPGLQAAWDAADAQLFAPLRARLGLDDADWVGSGAAPISASTLEFFAAIGIPISEVWGMSEISCLGTINPLEDTRIGTVGVAIPGLELRLADDGELLVRGPNVMRGYRSDPERTAEALDADGWLHTGDIARIDDDGYVSIVDRKKELIINSAGKNMSPANIENALKSSSPLIGQACTIGDRRPYIVALLVLDPDACAAWAAERGLEDGSAAALARDSDVRAAVAAAVEEANSRLSRVEQVKRFTLLPIDWMPDGDELTPTMKLKRRAIAEKYAVEIEALYQ
ncbi:MAG TPA: long-chain fatty acid--CoA ligase [Thermoleophilaceae bacterium]|nr:long-chain fatty acid--CoA ligase [Thermoleophilaceae bacterium]